MSYVRLWTDFKMFIARSQKLCMSYLICLSDYLSLLEFLLSHTRPKKAYLCRMKIKNFKKNIEAKLVQIAVKSTNAHLRITGNTPAKSEINLTNSFPSMRGRMIALIKRSKTSSVHMDQMYIPYSKHLWKCLLVKGPALNVCCSRFISSADHEFGFWETWTVCIMDISACECGTDVR